MMLDFVRKLFAPPRCAGCGERFDIFENDNIRALCDNCRAEWEKAKMSFCHGCGRESVACVCKGRYLKDVRILSLVKFGQKSCCDRLVYLLKRQALPRLTEFASNELCKRIRRDEELMATDYSDAIITNVPRNVKTKALYGFDHAEELAEGLAELMDVRYEKLLKRRFGGRPQKKMGEKKRLENVKGRFCAVSKTDISGARVILIDDVMTTGATASECVKILRQSGAREVILLTLARTESKRKQKV